mgnify:FL=1|nr:MAG TPA: hypothetical protein [Caudoviricetes sp.]
MELKDYLLGEMKRLNRINDSLEKKIGQEKNFNNEPEQILNNIKTMCEIVSTIN